LRFAGVLTGDRALAEDVVQEVLVRAYLRWEHIARMSLPVKSPISIPAKHGSPAARVYFFTSTAYFGYLPPTSANLAARRPAVPAGFTRTAIGALPKDLGGNPAAPASS
jgi:hypothetical protein